MISENNSIKIEGGLKKKEKVQGYIVEDDNNNSNNESKELSSVEENK